MPSASGRAGEGNETGRAAERVWQLLRREGQTPSPPHTILKRRRRVDAEVFLGYMLGRMAHEHDSPENNFESALRLLRDNQHRITAPRRAILSVLTQEHGPFTADEIHHRMEEGVCDLVTVYRCLSAMEEIAVVRRCDFGDGSYRYEFNTGEHHHHHIICRVCHGVETLDLCMADALERMARQMGYTNVTHTLEIFGVCKTCQAK